MMAFTRVNGEIGITATDVSKSANAEKIVPKEFISKDGTDVTPAFIEYAKPLIQGECDILYKNGIPAVLKRG